MSDSLPFIERQQDRKLLHACRVFGNLSRCASWLEGLPSSLSNLPIQTRLICVSKLSPLSTSLGTSPNQGGDRFQYPATKNCLGVQPISNLFCAQEGMGRK